ncbi:unnamed protein product [Timema podura]|uniref:Single domain-containing protein n=2 Tax=Timema TaxID=61471 RepID=A0A7R9JXM7_TIMGE|nr:unnamed protein product [Timema genevievae]CAG2052954.1 unnamed protein product [Timema podura]
MKLLACVIVTAVALVFALEDKKAEEAAGRPKTYKRLIPADVLRDFPGMCFASTRCATIEPGNTWDLSPFCGRSTCVTAENDPTRLLELVEDCGPLPKSNPKCKLSEKTNKTASFPECCPTFECEDGITLEYPEIPVAATATDTTTTSPKP